MLKMFVFIDIWFVKQDIQKWLKTKICSFLWRIWKWTNHFLTFWSRDSNPRFSVIFPPMIWIFMEVEDDEIKSKKLLGYRTLTLLLLDLKIVFYFQDTAWKHFYTKLEANVWLQPLQQNQFWKRKRFQSWNSV